MAQLSSKILVVDDESGIRDFLLRALELESFTVDLAENGQEAWHKIRRMTYDCVIMDLKMPGMSGQELFHEIEGLEGDTSARVIFITGDTVSSDTTNFVDSVNNPVLSKPLDVQGLRSEIQKIVEVTA